MKTFCKLLFPVLAIACASCATPERMIPAGLYCETGTRNFLSVSDEEVTVHIQGVDARDVNGNGLKFKYVLWSDDRFFLVVLRSVELLYGYPGLDYRLCGNSIVAASRGNETRWEFMRQR